MKMRPSRRAFLLGFAATLPVASVLTATPSKGWFPHGTGGGTPPPTVQWPTAIGGATNYWVTDPSNGGSDSNDGLAQTVGGGHGPWATIGKVNSFGGYGSGNIAVGFASTFTYTCPSGGGNGLQTPAGVAFCTFQGLVGATVPPVILANSSGLSGSDGAVIMAGNTTVTGLEIVGDGASNGVIMGSNTILSFSRVRNCYETPPVSGGGIGAANVIVGGDGCSVLNCTIGGTVPSSPDDNGIFCNFFSWNITIKNCTIGNIGGDQSSRMQTGYGIHTSGIFANFSTTPVPFTYSGGVPTNPLIEIAFNIVHDCGGNITDSTGGGPSGIEIGTGDRQWTHDNIVYNVRPVGAFVGGVDFDGIDAADSGATNTLTERNFCHGSYGGGVITFCSAAPPSWGPAIVRYNLLVDNGLDTLGNMSIQGFFNTGVHQVYGNTIVSTVGTGAGGKPYNIYWYTMQNAGGFFANNIVYTGSMATIPFTMGAADIPNPSGFVITNNNWFGASGRGYEWGGTNYGSYAAWAAGATNADTHGITGNPMFVGTPGSLTPLDYVLQGGSPCIGAGVDIAATFGVDAGSTYFNGVAVTSGAPSQGCMG